MQRALTRTHTPASSASNNKRENRSSMRPAVVAVVAVVAKGGERNDTKFLVANDAATPVYTGAVSFLKLTLR